MAVERYIVVCKPWKQFTFGKKEAVVGELFALGGFELLLA